MNPEIAAKLDALSAQFSDHDFDEFESRLRLHAAALGWTGDPMQQPLKQCSPSRSQFYATDPNLLLTQ